MRKLVSLVMLMLVTIGLSGCQAATHVTIKAERNGSGSIHVSVDLDQDAADALPRIRDQVQLKDLETRGWKVSVTDKTGNRDIARRLVVRYDFASIDEANVALTQLSAATGPFSNFALRQKRAFSNVDTEFSGVIDLKRGPDSFGTKEQADKTGAPLGFDLAELQKSMGFDFQKSFPVTVLVRLPGGNDAEKPAVGEGGKWVGVYGEAIPISATSRTVYAGPKVMIFIGIAAIFAVGAILAFWRPNARRRRRMTRFKKDVTPGL